MGIQSGTLAAWNRHTKGAKFGKATSASVGLAPDRTHGCLGGERSGAEALQSLPHEA